MSSGAPANAGPAATGETTADAPSSRSVASRARGLTPEQARAYNLKELSIARNREDPRRVMPPIRATDRAILDVGCGAGQTLIASELGPDVVRIGIDIDPAGLVQGHELDDTIGFVCGKGESLPFKSQSFDMVVARVSLPYMRTRPALAEFGRVLRDDGALWLTLHHFPFVAREFVKAVARFDVMRAAYRFYVLTNGVSSHVIGREFACPYTGGRVESFQTRGGIARSLHTLGFVNVESVTTESFFIVTATKRSGSPVAARR
jgi:ubiquinone/menaquinone biosynthesis C-methylase UbiE